MHNAQSADQISEELPETSIPAERASNVPAAKTVAFEGLKMMSKRHEHLNKVRQTQNAALRIQRAWKRYKNKTC